MCLYNAIRVYRHEVNSKITDLDFRMKVIQEMLDLAGTARKSSGRPCRTTGLCKLVPSSPGSRGKAKLRRCSGAACQAANKTLSGRKRKETPYKCESCKTPVCVTCFEPHKKRRL